MNKKMCWAAFFLGLFAVLWVGAGYVGGSPLALGMTAIIGLVYLAGAAELRRFGQATDSLRAALAAIPDNLPGLDNWLDTLHPSLRNAVRLRIEGERVALPGPALTPYLVGMLVLLGMLGTFLGMVVTLNGAVLALESTTDLHTIRAALAAPVKGLGVAFGTSVAGVAASTLLGLISALLRRERLAAGQLLDARIGTTLRAFSLPHQREETYRALQAQAQALPEMVGALQAMMAQLEQHNRQLGEQLLAGQQRHYDDATRLYGDLAASVDRSLKDSLVESARVAGATIQPVVEATMSGIARETTVLHGRMADTVQAQLDGLAARFDTAVGSVTATWSGALASHEAGNARLQQQLQDALRTYADTFEARSATLLASVGETHANLQGELASALAATRGDTRELHEQLAASVGAQLDGLSARFGDAVGRVSETWTAALAAHAQSSAAMSQDTRQSLAAFVARFEEGATGLLASVGGAHDALRGDLAAAEAARLATMTASVEALAATLQREWQAVGARTLAQQEQIVHTLGDTARAMSAEARAQAGQTIAEVTRLMETAADAPRAAAEVIQQLRTELSASIARDNSMLEERSRSLEQGAARLLATLQESHLALRADLAAADQQRLATLTERIEALASTLQCEWQAVGERTLAQQEQIVRTLGDTARAMSAEARAQAGQTIAEVTRLMETAADAPRAAAEVIHQLRQALSDSMARDNTLLDERSRIMETLASLLDAINHASTEQRGAIDALVATSGNLLERIGSRFEARVEDESARLADATSRLGSGAVEVASLGEALGLAVQLFSDASDRMMQTLERIEGALEGAVARSDEQLAYYVAQAREIIELSVMSQKQIVENLQQLSSRQASLAGEG